MASLLLLFALLAVSAQGFTKDLGEECSENRDCTSGYCQGCGESGGNSASPTQSRLFLPTTLATCGWALGGGDRRIGLGLAGLAAATYANAACSGICAPSHDPKPSDFKAEGGFLPSEGMDDSLIEGTFLDNVAAGFDILVSVNWADPSSSYWEKVEVMFSKLIEQNSKTGFLTVAWFANQVSAYLFPYNNFVSGFQSPHWGSKAKNWILCNGWPETVSCNMWNPPVAGEKMNVVTYQAYAKKHFGKEFPFPFFDNYYTGDRVPSWEDNENHRNSIKNLDLGVKVAIAAGGPDITAPLRRMEPRFAFDTDFEDNGIIDATWNGFGYMGGRDIKYASNGVWGVDVMNKLLAKFGTTDALGLLMTESVFSAHLVYKADDESFNLNLTSMEVYKSLPGYAAMGGRATFKYNAEGRLATTRLEYGGEVYTTFTGADEDAKFAQSKLVGWRFAEKAIIASLLSMTNLVLHVKDLHLEIAAAFQATTVDSFSADPTHPVRRMLAPFIHRSVQATNDNFKLLFEYQAAEFSLAPLPYMEQLQLMQDFIDNKPLYLDELDMENYGKMRDMPAAVSEKAAYGDDSGTYFWRWHYRALTVQRLYETMVRCYVAKNYPGNNAQTEAAIAGDAALQKWWGDMQAHMPALSRAVNRPDAPAKFEGGFRGMVTLDKEGLVQVAKILMVWLSWIHEDVGHAASAYVYNPVHTPMCVPEDGEGIPMVSFLFNTAAYRGFVFLERAKLLGEAPKHWFGDNDKVCFTDFQAGLTALGATDPAFSECDQTGFYTCVERVETAVSS